MSKYRMLPKEVLDEYCPTWSVHLEARALCKPETMGNHCFPITTEDSLLPVTQLPKHVNAFSHYCGKLGMRFCQEMITLAVSFN